MERIRLMFIGDDTIGKTTYLVMATSTTNTFPEYLPTNGEFGLNPIVDGKMYNVELLDSNGSDEFDRIRPLSYHCGDVFLVCFDIGNRVSFERIERKWLPELDQHRPEVPKILVGHKSDLRQEGNSQIVVTFEEGRDLAEKHNMLYQEHSALQNTGIHDVITAGVRLAMRDRYNKTKQQATGVKGFFKKIWKKRR